MDNWKLQSVGMVSSDSESTLIEKKIKVEPREDGVKVYQWTFPGLRWVSAVVVFFERLDSFKEPFEPILLTETLKARQLLLALLSPKCLGNV